MRRAPTFSIIGALMLSACASAPEMKMTPAASGDGVGVRFSRGEAFMVSAGENGAIMLVPVRYNQDSGKALFIIAGYNRSSVPINFGTENVSIALDTGASMPIYDFDTMRHNYKAQAEGERLMATVEVAADAYAAYRVSRHDRRRGLALMENAAGAYDDRLHSIADNLANRVGEAKGAVLQTTTIDPKSYWAGWIIADQPPLAPGEVRQMIATVSFAGERHTFRLF
jgi:hypothetical protein